MKYIKNYNNIYEANGISDDVKKLYAIIKTKMYDDRLLNFVLDYVGNNLKIQKLNISIISHIGDDTKGKLYNVSFDIKHKILINANIEISIGDDTTFTCVQETIYHELTHLYEFYNRFINNPTTKFDYDLNNILEKLKKTFLTLMTNLYKF